MISTLSWVAFLAVGFGVGLAVRAVVPEDRPAAVICYASLVSAATYLLIWFLQAISHLREVAVVAGWGFDVSTTLSLVALGAGIYGLAQGEAGARWGLVYPTGLALLLLGFIVFLTVSLQRAL